MHIAISFPPGFTVDGIVLQACGRTLRVAVRNWDDIAIFSVQNGHWVAENGDPVTIAPRDLVLSGTNGAAPAPYDHTEVTGVVWDALPASAPAMSN